MSQGQITPAEMCEISARSSSRAQPRRDPHGLTSIDKEIATGEMKND